MPTRHGPTTPAPAAPHRLSRRRFLRIGALGLGGLTLPALLRAEAAATCRRGPVTDGSQQSPSDGATLESARPEARIIVGFLWRRASQTVARGEQGPDMERHERSSWGHEKR